VRLIEPDWVIWLFQDDPTVRLTAALQLRRAISIQAEARDLLENHAVAPSAASACYATGHRDLKVASISFTASFSTD